MLQVHPYRFRKWYVVHKCQLLISELCQTDFNTGLKCSSAAKLSLQAYQINIFSILILFVTIFFFLSVYVLQRFTCVRSISKPIWHNFEESTKNLQNQTDLGTGMSSCHFQKFQILQRLLWFRNRCGLAVGSFKRRVRIAIFHPNRCVTV